MRNIGARFATALFVLLTVCALQGGVAIAADGKAAGKAADAAKTGDSTSSTQSTDGILQGHSADSPIQPGTIVQLIDKATLKVAPAEFDKANKMYGVVVTSNNLPLTITSDNMRNQLYVALSGTHDVLVSTQNGSIKAGDYITISAVDGIGMAALPGVDVTVIGRAAEGFDGKANVLGSVQLKDKGGKDAQKVSLGAIPIVIDIRDNPKEKSTKANVPPFLERLGEAVADKQVSPIRIYLSIAITGITIVVALVLLYAGVRNAIIAIGRNPLSKKSIVRTLIEVTLTGFIILIIGLFTVYLLLKL